MTVRFLDAARDDWREAILYYETQRPGLGAEFRQDVRQTVKSIMAFPLSWQS